MRNDASGGTLSVARASGLEPLRNRGRKPAIKRGHGNEGAASRSRPCGAAGVVVPDLAESPGRIPHSPPRPGAPGSKTHLRPSGIGIASDGGATSAWINGGTGASRALELSQLVRDSGSVLNCETGLDAERVFWHMRGLAQGMKEENGRARRTLAVDWGPLISRLTEVAHRADTLLAPAGTRGMWAMTLFYVGDLIRAWFGKCDTLSSGMLDSHGTELLGVAGKLLAIGFAPSGNARAVVANRGRARQVEAPVSGDPLLRGCVFAALKCMLVVARKARSDSHGNLCSRIESLLRIHVKREDHQHVMFLLGHHFTELAAHDPAWESEMAALVFPASPGKENLFVAALTGFLLRPPTPRRFHDTVVRKLYERGLALDCEPYDPGHYTDYKTAIAEHFAQAYLHFRDFGPDAPLLTSFLQMRDIGQHKAFVRKIGGTVLSEFTRGTGRMRARLPWVWEWMLENHTDPGLFAQFSRWINVGNGIFSPCALARLTRSTLKKSGGRLDEGFGLTACVKSLAFHAPSDTLEIVKAYLGHVLVSPRLNTTFHFTYGPWAETVDKLRKDARRSGKESPGLDVVSVALNEIREAIRRREVRRA